VCARAHERAPLWLVVAVRVLAGSPPPARSSVPSVPPVAPLTARRGHPSQNLCFLAKLFLDHKVRVDQLDALHLGARFNADIALARRPCYHRRCTTMSTPSCSILCVRWITSAVTSSVTSPRCAATLRCSRHGEDSPARVTRVGVGRGALLLRDCGACELLGHTS
jgi:hypothetical protein